MERICSTMSHIIWRDPETKCYYLTQFGLPELVKLQLVSLFPNKDGRIKIEDVWENEDYICEDEKSHAIYSFNVVE